MNLLRFTGKQYNDYSLVSVATYQGIVKSRAENSQEAKNQVIAKTYTIAKAGFENIRQASRNYQPKSLLEKMLKPILLSALNLFLAAQLAHINSFLKVNPVKKEEVKVPVLAVEAPKAELVADEAPKAEEKKPVDPFGFIPSVAEIVRNTPKIEGKPLPYQADPFAHLNPFRI